MSNGSRFGLRRTGGRPCRPSSARLLAYGTIIVATVGLGTVLEPGSARSRGVYTVSKLNVDMTAKDAVTAKKKALAEAELRAFRILLKRITPSSAYDRLPRLKRTLIQDLLEGLSVRSEKNSHTRYLATLDFSFQPRAVKQVLSAYGVPFSDQQAQPFKLVPLLFKDDALEAGSRHAWRRAWSGLDLTHALTPVRLGHRTEALTAEKITAIVNGDAAELASLQKAQGSRAMILAIARLESGKGRLQTQLYGFDQTGALNLVRSDRIFDGNVDAAARRAAEIALRIFEGRWKFANAGGGAAGTGASAQKVALTATFSGLQEWQQLRSRLARVPGVRALEVVSLSARSAEVQFQFAGGAARLTQQLTAHKFNLLNEGGIWILRSN